MKHTQTFKCTLRNALLYYHIKERERELYLWVYNDFG